MKRFIVLVTLLLTILLFAVSGWTFCSGWRTGDANILANGGRGYLISILVLTDGTNQVTFNVYDSTSATGTKLIDSWIVTTDATTDRAQMPQWPAKTKPFDNGIYVDVTVAGGGSVKYEVCWQYR